MSNTLALKNINVFTSKEAFDNYVAGVTIPDSEINLVGDFVVTVDDIAWKIAYTGSYATLNTVFCTVPSTWKEVIIKYDWASDRNADSFMLIPRTGWDSSRMIKPSDNEIGIWINSSYQVQMVHRGEGSDALVKGVYYR